MAVFKGFAGGEPAPESLSPDEMERNFEAGVTALLLERPAEAYLYFSKADKGNSAVLYNTALCFYIAGMFERVLPLLECALHRLPAFPAVTVSVPQELEQFERENEGYKKAMLLSAPELFPERCRISILRLKADTLFAAGKKEELKRLLPELAGKHYKNIEALVEILRNEV